MIQVMGWIPADFPNSCATTLMRSSFSEAVGAFSLQQAVRNVSALRGTEAPPQDGVDPRADSTEDLRPRLELTLGPTRLRPE